MPPLDDFDADTGADDDLSIEDALSSAWAESTGEPAPDIDGMSRAAAPAPATPAAPAAGETPAQADARQRDEQGRFKPADQTPPVGSTKAGQQPLTPEAMQPPATWSATAKSKFNTLDPVVQQEVLRREREMDEGRAQWQQKAESYNRLDAILAPRREQFQLAGLDDARAVQVLFAAQDYLQRDPVNAIAYLAKQAGVDLRRYAAASPGGQAVEPPMPPAVQELTRTVQSLQQRLDQREQQSQQAARSTVLSEVDAFSKDPKHVYFENVRDDMAHLFNSKQVQTLDEAYERAIWAHPEIRPLLLQQQDQERAAAARTRTSAARLAAGSITGSPAPGSSPASAAPADSIEDELRRAWAAAS